ncbi:MAG: hypothetical protein H3C48_19910, partial [Chitinophagaceae bacterium]|nr:hypothetical protein [Chitinophagaceae bacterium]
TVRPGKNQYGQAHTEIWQQGELEKTGERIAALLSEGFGSRFSPQAFQNTQLSVGITNAGTKKQLSFLPVPENKNDNSQVQLG